MLSTLIFDLTSFFTDMLMSPEQVKTNCDPPLTQVRFRMLSGVRVVSVHIYCSQCGANISHC